MCFVPLDHLIKQFDVGPEITLPLPGVSDSLADFAFPIRAVVFPREKIGFYGVLFSQGKLRSTHDRNFAKNDFAFRISFAKPAWRGRDGNGQGQKGQEKSRNQNNSSHEREL